MSDLTLIATQGYFGDADDRIAALGTQGFYQEVVFVPPDILVMEISMSSSRGEIAIIRRDGIRIVRHGEIDIV